MGAQRRDEALRSRFAGLLERNQRRISRICRSWARSAAEREDLVAEVHLQLWRALPGFEGRAAEDTWVYRVTLNTALLHARRRSRRAPESPLADEEAVPASAPSAQARLEGRERLERLRAALRELSERDRTLLTLWLEELPYRRIAEVTGLDENRVGVGLHRARERLKRLVDAKERTDGTR